MGLNENLEVIKKIYPKIKGYEWMITGSTNLALQGMDVDPRDLDILTDPETAHSIAKKLKEYEIEPLQPKHFENLDSINGIYVIDGVEVEVIGFPKKFHMVEYNIEGFSIPLRNLEDEMNMYAIIGREDKARRIKEHMKHSKQD